MAMTETGMGAAIKAAIIALSGAPANDTELTNFCNALGKAIVDYIQANAVANGTCPSGGGPLSGGTVS